MPSPDAQQASVTLQTRIQAHIQAAGGWIGFDQFMAAALYETGLGYYAGGSQKFGAAGDFVTAPELSPLFARCLAQQIGQWLGQGLPHVLEAGAGSGALAAELLLALERAQQLPQTYFILEVSGELRARQHATLHERAPHLLPRVQWLNDLPSAFEGVVIGNELLDAMPAHLVHWHASGKIFERGVCCADEGRFAWAEQPAQGRVLQAAQALAAERALPADLLSEINLAAAAWIAEWATRLQRGALLLIDYGYPRSEYYLPQRNRGTLLCHYRHHTHDDPFWFPGLNDITAHVDFTAMADTAFANGLDVLGYTSQASFLMNCGVLSQLEQLAEVLGVQDQQGAAWLRLTTQLNRLTSPNEMGELFKVLALGREVSETPIGFVRGDRTHVL